jgi:enoyl-CoA hydratase
MRSQSLWLTINRSSKKNALTPEILRQITLKLADASLDPTCRVVVITGTDGSFSSGYDLGELTSDEGKREADEVLSAANDALQECDLPTIARIDGWCVGAGLEFALSCDVRVCTSRSVFFLPAARLGIIYPNHGLKRVIDAVGLSSALRIVLFGERFTSEQALQLGLVDAIDDDIDGLVETWAQRVIDGDPTAITAMKHALRALGQVDEQRG